MIFNLTGDEYTGEFVEGKMDGTGVYHYLRSGSYYFGEFFAGKMNGKAVIYF